MSRTRTSLLRRTVMWAVGVLLISFTFASLVSRVCWIEWNEPPLWTLGLRGGWAYGGNGGGYSAPGFHVLWPSAPEGYGPELHRLPKMGGGVNWGFTVPLWMPATAAALPLAACWTIAYRRRRAWRTAGLCPVCAYDLTGITGPCPECGKEREA
ncbi:MAG TPA: hypothetical protein VFF65_05105 [Phycisphaerales bacterium]|nr:hypothetical protein [Phycisphaerales bacterium]